MMPLAPSLPRTLPHANRRSPSLLRLALFALVAVSFAVTTISIAWLRVAPRATPPIFRRASAVSLDSPTNIAIGPQVLHAEVERFGINLSGQTFYDSGQMLRNLVFRNPGFEGETWQSFLHCKAATATTCTDENPYTQWPAGFLNDARFEVLSGRSAGQTGTIRSSSASSSGHGIVLVLAAPIQLAPGDFLLVHVEKPGDAQAGWWTSINGGATISTEFNDLSPHTPGRQALRMDATAPRQYASVSSYFDSTEGRSFLQLHGPLRLSFRAKWISGGHQLTVTMARLDKAHGTRIFLQQDVPLTSAWQDFTLVFKANEESSARGTLALSFAVSECAALLDDVSFEPLEAADNPTAFRDEVVASLRTIHPGILRFMDNGTSFGSTLDDLLAPPFARRRGGWHLTTVKAEDIPIGLHESLVLAQTLHADPWYTLPATISPAETASLIEYLAGPVTSRYGGKRAALGQSIPWTSVFHTIHLEFGNEMWNAGDFAGAALSDPGVYAARASAVFTAARHSPYFGGGRFDLVADGQAGNTWLTTQLTSRGTQADSIDFAPYLFGQFNDASSLEAIFGAMFAEPELEDTGDGQMAQQVRLARTGAHPLSPAVYEVNLGTSSTSSNSIAQAQIESTVPSVGGAIAVADHMLLMLRELGITHQCLFALPEYANHFASPTHPALTMPLWGSVIDMGGPTNLRRPTFLALQVMNRAILSHELATRLTGANPVWDQPASANDQVPAGQHHLLQVFAFADGAPHSLLVINLSRSASLAVTFSGPDQPQGTVTESRLTSANIADSNEREAKVVMTERAIDHFNPRASYRLPPFSMTALTWQAHP